MGTLLPFSSLHPLIKGRESHCQIIKKKTAILFIPLTIVYVAINWPLNVFLKTSFLASFSI